MAVQHNCDRCEKHIKEYMTYNNVIHIPTFLHLVAGKDVKAKPMKDIDLCANCLAELREFLGMERADRFENPN